MLLWLVEISMMKGQDFMIKDRHLITVSDFHDDGSKFYCEWSRYLWWEVEYFYNERLRFYYERSRFLRYQQVEIFMIIGQNFHDDRSKFYYEWFRFSWWQVKILFWIIAGFFITGWDFYDGRPRIFLFCFDIKVSHWRKCQVVVFQ